MTHVSLTNFVDFVSATGTARIACVRGAKRQYEAEYKPQIDYWKGWRDRTDACIDAGWSADNLRKSLTTVLDVRKHENYEICTDGFVKFVGRKKIVRLDPVRSTWTGADGALSITVNPELHIALNGSPYVVKYYLREEPLKKQKADVALHLLGKFAPANNTVGLLDVRRPKLFVPTRDIDGIDALLEGDALAFKTIWDSI